MFFLLSVYHDLSCSLLRPKTDQGSTKSTQKLPLSCNLFPQKQTNNTILALQLSFWCFNFFGNLNFCTILVIEGSSFSLIKRSFIFFPWNLVCFLLLFLPYCCILSSFYCSLCLVLHSRLRLSSKWPIPVSNSCTLMDHRYPSLCEITFIEASNKCSIVGEQGLKRFSTQ